MKSKGHDVHDSPNEEELYSSPDPMVIIQKKVIKVNKELAHLLDLADQNIEVKQRITLVMKQIRTYKVITII
jgi:hypothetical protein